MNRPEILRIVSHLDDIEGRWRRAWAAAVIHVPGAASDLEPLMAVGETLGERLGREALDRLDRPATAYGKSAVVGAALDIEQAAAILHPRLGKPLRALLGGGKALIPSTVKKGGPGTGIDVPLHGKDNEWDFSLLDSIEVALADAPREREIVIVVALASGGRAKARIGVA